MPEEPVGQATPTGGSGEMYSGLCSRGGNEPIAPVHVIVLNWGLGPSVLHVAVADPEVLVT